jgi:hypothetical protein
MAQNELLELKQRHDEERMRLAIERQQLDNKRDGSRILGETLTSHNSLVPPYNNKAQAFDVANWNCLPKERHSEPISVIPAKASLLSNSKSCFGQPSWVVENIEVVFFTNSIQALD